MIFGLSLQVFTLMLFGLLACEYAFRVYKFRDQLNVATHPAAEDGVLQGIDRFNRRKLYCDLGSVYLSCRGDGGGMAESADARRGPVHRA
jgi:hypothetical protein